MARKDKLAKREAQKKKAQKALATREHAENKALKRHLSTRGHTIDPKLVAAVDLAQLDEMLLDGDRQLRIRSSAVYDKIDHMTLRFWCNRRAFYGLPTTELISWLQEFIGDRSAIEVGSGNGALGRALDIPRTDSHLQRRPDVAMQYMLQGQPTIPYASDVQKLEAMDAVRMFKPQVVVGSWVTHWIDPHKPFPEGGGNMYGLHEDQILDHPGVEAYVVVGHTNVHSHKPILKRPHRIIEAPWLRSRGADPEGNRIYIWEV